MSERFLKFKRRATVFRLIKSILLGFSLGLTTYGALSLLAEFRLITFAPLYIILTACAATVVGAAIMYLFLHKSDTRLASQLDEQLGLNERLQTMLEFRGEDGPMLDLQREDAENELAKVPLSQLKIKRIWIYLTAFVLSAAVFASSFIFKYVEAPPEEEPEIPFSITEIQIEGVNELIRYVGESELDSPYKENICLILTELLDELKLVETEKQRDAALDVAMGKIYEETDASSPTVEILNTLWATETTELRVLIKAMNSYSWTVSKEWDSFTEALTAFRTEFIKDTTAEGAPDESTLILQISETLAACGNDISVLLTKTGVDESDALYAEILRFATSDVADGGDGTSLYGLLKLSEIAQGLAESNGENRYNTLQKEIDASIKAFGVPLFNAIDKYMMNTNVGEYSMRRLAELFGCSLPAFERPSLYTSSTGGDIVDDGGSGAGGGVGNGQVFGSDDYVLDPSTGELVKFGEIIDKYYALVFSKLQSGKYTEEEAAAIEKYYQILYGGFDETEE